MNEYAQKTAKSAKSYELNTSVFSTLVETPLVENLHRTSGETPLVTSGKIPHTKTTIKTTNTKTNISKEYSKKIRAEKPKTFDAKSIELPPGVNRDLWNQFVDMREAKRKPLTENAVSLLIKKWRVSATAQMNLWKTRLLVATNAYSHLNNKMFKVTTQLRTSQVILTKALIRTNNQM